MTPATVTAPAEQRDSVADLFRDTIACVRSDVPEAHDRFVAELDTIAFGLSIGPETFGLRHGQVGPAPRHAAASLSTNVATLHALVVGRIALTTALAERSLTLIGAPRTIAAIDRSLRLLVHGIVRSPAAPALMQRLERLAQLAPAESAQSTERSQPQPKEPS